LIDFILKTAKRKLPLHDLLIVKATAPFHFIFSLLAFFLINAIIIPNELPSWQ